LAELSTLIRVVQPRSPVEREDFSVKPNTPNSL
jgi:hypothetical protein